MSERDTPPQSPEPDPSPGHPSARPLRGAPGSEIRDERDEREIRRLAAAAFGGAGQGDGIHFGCPDCGQAITVEDRGAGSRVICPACGARIDVPQLAPPRERSPGGGVTRPARLPKPRPGNDGTGESPHEVPERREARLSHDDQHRLNPQRKAKFVPFEGTVAPAYGEPGAPRPYAGPNRGPGWIRITLGVLGALALGAGIYVFLSRTKGAPAERGTGSGESSLSPEVEALLAFYGRFREATTPEERAAFVRHPELTLPRLMRYYQLRGIDPPSPMLLPHTATTVTEDGVEFIRCDAQFKSRTVQAYFEKTDAGGFLVDWESLVGYSDDEWGLFVQSIPDDPQEFRAFIAGDEYFGDEFPDSAKASCARLYHLDGGNDLYGYVPRGSDLDAPMAALLQQAAEKAERPVPCRVRVRFVRPGKNGRQVEILSLTPGWLVPVEEPPVPEAPSEDRDAPVPEAAPPEPTVPPHAAPDPDSPEPESPEGAPDPDSSEPDDEEAVPRAVPPAPQGRREITPSARPPRP